MPVKGAGHYAVVQVDEVDVDNRLFHAIDKTNSNYQVSFREMSSGIFVIPEQGDFWLVELIGHQWHMISRLDTQFEHEWAAANMTFGDMRITQNRIFIRASGLQGNGQGWGPPIRDVFKSNSPFTTVTLSLAPVGSASIQIFINGLLMEPSLWSWDGDVSLAFSPSMGDLGTMIVHYQSWTQLYEDDGVVVGRGVVSGVESYTP